MITLATLPQATAQEVFDQMATHLLTQNEKSAGYLFRYRLGRLKCAAGCLISDDEYKKSWEGRDWDTLVNLNEAPKAHTDLILELQRIHDGPPPPYGDRPSTISPLASI